MNWDLEQMREWIRKQPTSSARMRRARIALFDLYRYQEDYEKIYQMVQDLTNS